MNVLARTKVGAGRSVAAVEAHDDRLEARSLSEIMGGSHNSQKGGVIMTLTINFLNGNVAVVPTTPATIAADKAAWEQNPNVDYVK